MALERITAWLRIRDRARFVRDAKIAERAIKDIGDAANNAGSPLNQLGGALSSLVGDLPQAGGRSRVFGFAIGTVASAFVAVIPLVVGLGGALTALVGSMGAAALGAGVLGVALAGAALPFGAFALVALDAFKGFTKVNTAFQRYQVAVHAFGRESQQAETALARLNAIAETMGGRFLVTLADRWDKFLKAFREANKPAMRVILGIFSDMIGLGMKVIPVIAGVAHAVAVVLRSGLRGVVQDLRGAGIGDIFKILTNAFQSLAGPLIKSATDILIGFFEIAARLAPDLGIVSSGIGNIASAFRNWATNGDLSGLVAQFQSWMGLIKATGGLLVTVFGTGAKDGKGMVDSITKIINRWNDFLKTTRGQSSLKSFFHDSVAMTSAFMQVMVGVTSFLFKFGRAALPIYTTVFNALRSGVHTITDAFSTWAPTWNNIVKPLLEGLAGGIIGGVIGAFKLIFFAVKLLGGALGLLTSHLGFLQGVFKALGWVIGFVFGGEILDLLSGIGKLSILLRPLGFLFKLLLWPIDRAGALVGVLFRAFGRLIGIAGTFAARFIRPVADAIGGVLDWLVGAGRKFYNAGYRLWNAISKGMARAIGSGFGFAGDIGKAVYNWVAGRINRMLPNRLGPINLPDNPLPMLAGGGIVSGTGSWISGEAGPELNTMDSRGRVRVQPLTPGIQPLATNASVAPNGGGTTVAKVYLKGRQIAEAVAEEADDELTRKGRK